MIFSPYSKLSGTVEQLKFGPDLAKIQQFEVVRTCWAIAKNWAKIQDLKTSNQLFSKTKNITSLKLYDQFIHIHH